MKIKNTPKLVLELCSLFVLVPAVLAYSPYAWLNIMAVILALCLLVEAIKQEWSTVSFSIILAKLRSVTVSRQTWYRILGKWFVFASIACLLVYIYLPDKLFHVLINQPILWLIIVLIYTFLSVLPQEFLYRTFFFKRYAVLGLTQSWFIFLNALLFSLGHLMFHNNLVMVLTFCGGLLFAYTYTQTKSFIAICVEHALYGLWLFTVGIGGMLAFPGG
ncbi:CPBP family intramembrane glutamic endopeptidase [Glaciecola petra]|uniref:CPBP family intramembrane glutamic endopeptidase n=1 Tax=Glaciecola petra TaxID=3075602 RepID=A0ABU2ZQ42_9ALTE|nr:CPBP family intramembrane glutamic endopeptidase [Aestuariibacter sp. P117]MDT0594459.1 CPBP family intramembrane glutamic endopeptidase [Aestuariibacter sp. P117]